MIFFQIVRMISNFIWKINKEEFLKNAFLKEKMEIQSKGNPETTTLSPNSVPSTLHKMRILGVTVFSVSFMTVISLSGLSKQL